MTKLTSVDRRVRECLLLLLSCLFEASRSRFEKFSDVSWRGWHAVRIAYYRLRLQDTPLIAEDEQRNTMQRTSVIEAQRFSVKNCGEKKLNVIARMNLSHDSKHNHKSRETTDISANLVCSSKNWRVLAIMSRNVEKKKVSADVATSSMKANPRGCRHHHWKEGGKAPVKLRFINVSQEKGLLRKN